MKKTAKNSILAVIAIILVILSTSFMGYNSKNQNILVIQLGEVVKVVEEQGIFFKLPIIQKTKKVYIGEQLYDVQASEVITSDKKSMIANCYVTWKVTNPKKYYQTLASESVAQSRIEVAVYNAMKNIISSTKQDDVISGKDGSLSSTILNKISMEEQYGIQISAIEMKQLDLPGANKDAVYSRMISERQAIAAEYKANGEKESKNIKSQTDAEVRKIVSKAEVTAADTEAKGESEYFKILADSYGKSSERKEFYNFIIALDSMKESLAEGGTIAIDEDSPIYKIINNQ